MRRGGGLFMVAGPCPVKHTGHQKGIMSMHNVPAYVGVIHAGDLYTVGGSLSCQACRTSERDPGHAPCTRLCRGNACGGGGGRPLYDGSLSHPACWTCVSFRIKI
jgi:hypothetical protein